MSNETCPTVKVKEDNEDGFVVINEADFDPKVHDLFEEDHGEDEPKRRGRPPKGKD